MIFFAIRIIEINNLALNYFKGALKHEIGIRARDYLGHRCITKKTQELFQIGYAPDRWDSLLKALQKRGVSEEELENTNAVSSTRDYTNFLLKNAENNSIDSIAISLLPCQWGYSEIGKGLFKKSSLNPDTFHYKWIESYNSQEYQEVTDWLITFVNSIGKNIDKDNVEIFSELFKRGIEFEIDFWESAWLLKKN